MVKRVLIIQGHPDPAAGHFDHALAEAYSQGAAAAGHDVRLIQVARLEFPLLRSKREFDHGDPPAAIRDAQEHISWANHLVIVYPLWLGTMPALLKAFLEQVLRPKFAFELPDNGRAWRSKLGGKSARIVITMGMPAFFYRWYFGAHSLKSLERNVLKFCGIRPMRETLVGMVESVSDARRAKWLARLNKLGRAGY